jgi:uncharacterized protein (UPF0335 family)
MTEVGGIAGDHLKAYVERIERLNEEIKALNQDKAEVFAEAKGNGFDVKTMKALVRRRQMTGMELQEADALLDLYERAVNEAPSCVREAA